MRPEIKYLSLGLTIGFFIAAILMAGMFLIKDVTAFEPVVFPSQGIANPATDEPTNTPPATLTQPATSSIRAPATNTPILTETPSPTATIPAIEQMLARGEIFFTGPLTQQQQIRLYEASLEYIAPTTKQARQVGVTINGAGYGSPSLICGPLSLAIMQGAGLIEYPDVVPHDFWLLNPYVSKDRILINKVFPPEKYEATLFKIPLNKFDWKAFPLQPGDFLFIRHGTGGNFDHMLVVNRVDSQMRPYSVTNFNTENGYIIDEVMLYDPNDPAAGIFHTWTKKQNALLGSTGFGGFEAWRLRSP